MNAPLQEHSLAGSLGQVTVFCDSDLVHAAHVFTGLFELESRGRLEVRMALIDRDLGPRQPFTVWAHWRSPTGRLRRVCFDLHDVSSVFCQESLDACDVYLKSNFRAHHVAALGERGERVSPLGLYAATRAHR